MPDARKNWITVEKLDKRKASVLLFRRKIVLDSRPEDAIIQISADSRYKLYINDQFAEAGPCKGDREVWYYDEVNIASYLQKGTNTIAVEVLYYPEEHGKGSYSIFRTGHPGLYVHGSIQTDEEQIDISADERWRCIVDHGVEIIPESEIFAPLQLLENRKQDPEILFWKKNIYDDHNWESAVYDKTLNLQISPGNLLKREIPYLYRVRKQFKSCRWMIKDLDSSKNEKDIAKEEWTFSTGKDSFTVSPKQRLTIEFDAGEEETGYLNLFIAGGKGSGISILTSEGYVQEGFQGDLNNPYKEDRLDCEQGYLHGFTDTYIPAGTGTAEHPEVYRPFWFRTFRFVRIEIETTEEPLDLLSFYYEETGYPLVVKTRASADDPDFSAIWDISERTLRRCMHETYEDCPFYEQLQYAMDARTQILYTYTIAADDRLARKCMEDFRRSQRYDGLTNSCHPNYESNVIPGFSIYYILMVYDHMMYFGDKELVRTHLPHIDRVLGFFHRNLTKEGYVGKLGGLNGKDRFWSFIDWTAEWDETTGVPKTTLKGPITMESLLYIYGLQAAEKLACFVEWKDVAKEYEAEAERVRQAVVRYMHGKKGMLTDGPGQEIYSQHTQVFAILTNTYTGRTGRKALLETILHKEQYPQCSVAMSYYLFRALEKTELYSYSKEYWGIWRRMLEKNSTTCIEDELAERSDCHAWGALILYELPAVILGVRPAEPGYQTVMIRPVPGYLTEAQGEVITPNGMVKVQWKKERTGQLQLSYELPENVNLKEGTFQNIM